jgi:hypothetical protein
MTGGLSTSASLAPPEASGEQINDYVIEKTHKKKKTNQSHAVEPEAEAQSEKAPPITPTKISRSYPPILPPPSPFAKKRVAEAQTLKAEYPTPILPPKYTQHASNGSGDVAEAETSSAPNDNKVPRDFYTQDWEESVGYVRANVKRNMDEESKTEESESSLFRIYLISTNTRAKMLPSQNLTFLIQPVRKPESTSQVSISEL